MPLDLDIVKSMIPLMSMMMVMIMIMISGFCFL